MGFIIKDSITTDFGLEKKDTYCTIKGQYSIVRRGIYYHDPDPLVLQQTGFNITHISNKYFLTCIVDIYYSKASYDNGNNALISNILINQEVDISTIVNMYEYVYLKAKETLKNNFNNQNMIFEDI